MKHLPWKVLMTVGVMGVVASVAMVVGQEEIALVAVGALGGYLGRVNGS